MFEVCTCSGDVTQGGHPSVSRRISSPDAGAFAASEAADTDARRRGDGERGHATHWLASSNQGGPPLPALPRPRTFHRPAVLSPA